MKLSIEECPALLLSNLQIDQKVKIGGDFLVMEGGWTVRRGEGGGKEEEDAFYLCFYLCFAVKALIQLKRALSITFRKPPKCVFCAVFSSHHRQS